MFQDGEECLKQNWVQNSQLEAEKNALVFRNPHIPEVNPAEAERLEWIP